MPRSILPTFALLAMLHSGALAGDRYAIDPIHSTVGFKIKHLFSYVTGKFDTFSGIIDVDPTKPESSRVDVKIDVKSINTGNERRDAHLRSQDFFYAERYPTIVFSSKKVTRTGENTADVVGDLAIHGTTREVILKVKFLGKGKGLAGETLTGWEARTQLKRSEYGLTWSKLVEGTAVVADDVEIELLIEAPDAESYKP
jgi:polyisoprenoid-binding protein YceI